MCCEKSNTMKTKNLYMKIKWELNHQQSISKDMTYNKHLKECVKTLKAALLDMYNFDPTGKTEQRVQVPC